MNKVKEGYLYKSKDVETGEVYESYLLWDVAHDEEGYGVVIGNEDDEQTIAFGVGQLSGITSKMLFDAAVREIQDRLHKKGGDLILSDEPLDFQYLSSPYDWVDKEVASHKDTENHLVKIMAYIAKYNNM